MARMRLWAAVSTGDAIVRPTHTLASNMSRVAATESATQSRYSFSHGASAPCSESCRIALTAPPAPASISCLSPTYSSPSTSIESAASACSRNPC